MKSEEYPALFCAADKASATAQKTYLMLTRLTLVLLIFGAGSAAVSSALEVVRSGFAVASAISVALSLALSIYLRLLKPEQIWYGGRAVAESVKSMTWCYMMGADPYFVELAPADGDSKFISTLESIVKERKQLAFGFGGEFSQQPQISQAMRAIRSAGLEERKSNYLSGRISDQRGWYGNQARSSRSAGNTYFILILCSQLLALVAAIILVRQPEFRLKLTGLFTSLASALIAWLQIKQHKEIAQSYSIAELELGFIQEQAQRITTSRELSNFVGDAENAISREHTLWIARRDRI